MYRTIKYIGRAGWVVLALGSLISCGGNSMKKANETPVPPAAAPAMPRRVLESRIAGSWYTRNPTQLAAELQGYLDEAQSVPLDSVQALILPHAGYQYSGRVAAFGVKQLAGRKYSRVIVMGPTHRVPMSNVISFPEATHVSTPLGEIPLDTAFIAELKKHRPFQSIRKAYEGEHSVEIEFPLLQMVLKDFQLVPLVVGQMDEPSVRAAAQVLCSLVDEKTLVVVSSDFTHYGSNYGYLPFRDNVRANLEKLDMGAYAEIEKKSVSGFIDYCERTGATICGLNPIAVLLAMLPASSQGHLLKYDTSGRMMNDEQNSVSYFSIAFSGAWVRGPAVQVREPDEKAILTPEEKKTLLELARKTLAYYFEHRKKPSPEDLGITITPDMKAVMGAFVTLTEGGQLRGCIGEIVPRRPLYQAVMDHALNAALNDWRFSPVDPSEMSRLVFEISALTPPHPVNGYNEIVIGKHGMTVSKNSRSAVFLPQVAPEQGWTLDETLTHLSVKAGLPPDAWKEGAEFEVFEAVVFSEGEE